ncbi:MAG TPA: DinB family protein [Ornithinibacter sp.]|nr:DinB family protein [Ornithinibacter sp.]
MTAPPPQQPSAGGGDAAIAPDDKDWTWTLREQCPDCGFVAADVVPADLAPLVTALTDPWPAVLARADAGRRPEASTWSPLEYACHVRDVCRLFEQRLDLMLTQDAPTFENWDQDRTAVTARYGEQDPAAVAGEITAAGASFAAAYAAVPSNGWGRTGIRSNGSEFTVLTLGQYGLHDLRHHLWDVGVDPS